MAKKIFIFFLPVLYITLSSTCGKQVRPVEEEVRYWNLNKGLKVSIPHRLAPKRQLEVTLIDGSKHHNLEYLVSHSSPTNFVINVKYPKLAPLPVNDTFNLAIRYKNSRKVLAEYTIIPDYHPPQLEIISQSSQIKQGGSAILIFRAEDEYIKHIYIKDNSGKVFFPRAFVEKDYYISLICWYIPYPRYSATLYAEDQAGNISQQNLDFDKKRTQIPVSILKVNPDFVASKKKELGLKKGTKENKAGYDEVKKKLASRSKVNVRYLTSYVSPGIYTNTAFQPFRPLAKHRVTSAFGKLRKYQYQGKITKQSYHMGLDIADLKNSPIYNSNPAEVAFADYNGGYGNTLVLNHGLGLYSLYGHCDSLAVKERQIIHPGTHVAVSGTTGYSTGDHVHFSILIQGIYADPEEWMDEKWLEENINSVIRRGKRIIAIRAYEKILLTRKK